MGTVPLDPQVDVTPFVARRFWSSPTDYEIWWEDPRDLYLVTVQLDPADGDSPPGPALAYWRNSWPRVRVAKGAMVGSGESGWLANDDWTNGESQPADCGAGREGNGWTYTFRPISAREFPEEKEFPAVFRRTLKIRLSFPTPGNRIRCVTAATDSAWKEAELAIEWKSITGEPTQWDGSLQNRWKSGCVTKEW